VWRRIRSRWNRYAAATRCRLGGTIMSRSSSLDMNWPISLCERWMVIPPRNSGSSGCSPAYSPSHRYMRLGTTGCCFLRSCRGARSHIADEACGSRRLSPTLGNDFAILQVTATWDSCRFSLSYSMWHAVSLFRLLGSHFGFLCAVNIWVLASCAIAEFSCNYII